MHQWGWRLREGVCVCEAEQSPRQCISKDISSMLERSHWKCQNSTDYLKNDGKFWLYNWKLLSILESKETLQAVFYSETEKIY